MRILDYFYKMMISTVFITIIGCSHCAKKDIQNETIEKWISSMSNEEKANLVTGVGFKVSLDPDLLKRDSLPINSGLTYGIERLGIPAVVTSDGPAGLTCAPQRAWDSTSLYYATAIPTASLMACSWDTSLVKKVGEFVGKEALEYGIDIWLGPSMNIHRNPLNGRNFEYYSEDPLLSGKLAAAMAKGAQSNGVGATLKHFVANNTETNRFGLNTIVSERALREIYLEGFRIAVEEAKPAAIMSSYNLLNDTYTCQSSDLLLKILRDEWNYTGFVMTDWWAGDNAVEMVKAGNDLIMPGEQYQRDAILEALNDNTIHQEEINRNIENILSFVVNSPKYKGYKYTQKPELKEHAELARKAAEEGMVLLKNNDHTLPIIKEKSKVAVYGNTALDVIIGGSGSGNSISAYKISLVDGLKSKGFELNDKLLEKYRNYFKEEEIRISKLPPVPFGMAERPEEMDVSLDILKREANEFDLGIVTIGRRSGEQFDRTFDNDYYLNEKELELIKNATNAYHSVGKKVIVVLNICGIVEMATWKDLPDAILLAWAGGQEAGNAMADIISGQVNPSGKLAITIPVKYEDVPSANNFPGIEGEKEGVLDVGFAKLPYKFAKIKYDEGIYNGYRYYESFGVDPLYEFGFGKSYTSFKYTTPILSSKVFVDKIEVSLTIKNIGDYAGKEIVQLYLTAPVHDLDKPAIELKGFAKTELLHPGQEQDIKFIIDSRSLASFDSSQSAWVAEAGTYEIKLGASSKDIRSKVKFELDKNLIVKNVNSTITPREDINELKAIR